MKTLKVKLFNSVHWFFVHQLFAFKVFSVENFENQLHSIHFPLVWYNINKVTDQIEIQVINVETEKKVTEVFDISRKLISQLTIGSRDLIFVL